MMIVGLLLLATSLLVVQVSSVVTRGRAAVDMFGLILLAAGNVLLISESAWFALCVLPGAGVFAVVANRYLGVTAQRGLKFRLEVQWLSLMVAVTAVIARGLDLADVAAGSVATAIAILLAVVAIALHLLLVVHLRRYRLGPTKKLALDDLDSLPTVSLLIPARNESHALNDTLTNALQATYPKLEVLVLDDCSHDKTPEIIRGFAHDGARFVEGKPTPEQWLGRNWALQQLCQAANGELLIFADVDVKFTDSTIAEIVGVVQRDQLDMASFVPAERTSGWLGRLLLPLTNFWLTLMPFQFLDTRAAIGRCFAVAAEALPDGQFASSKSSVYPTYTLAKQLIKNDRRYKFFFGRMIGLMIRKHYRSNAKSTIRTASPALANRFDLVMLVVLLSGLSLLPVLMFNGSWLMITAIGLTWLLFLRVSVAVNGWRWSFSSVLWPLLIAHELGLLIVSIIRYRFTDLYWKDRLVCMPLLQAESKLPDV